MLGKLSISLFPLAWACLALIGFALPEGRLKSLWRALFYPGLLGCLAAFGVATWLHWGTLHVTMFRMEGLDVLLGDIAGVIVTAVCTVLARLSGFQAAPRAVCVGLVLLGAVYIRYNWYRIECGHSWESIRRERPDVTPY
jgi:hypothetical protein